jgi:predicted enzyme related to lactoylglutathione lyase
MTNVVQRRAFIFAISWLLRRAMFGAQAGARTLRLDAGWWFLTEGNDGGSQMIQSFFSRSRCCIRLKVLLREHIVANPFIHVELNSSDPVKARAFYGSLFDWKLEDMPMPDGTYTMIDVGDGTGGGIMKHPMAGAPSVWIPYVTVDDVNAATEKARALGGTVIRDVTEIPDMGWFSIVLDPTGAAFGIWKTKAQ